MLDASEHDGGTALADYVRTGDHLAAAKQIGLTIPQTLLLRANEVTQ
jgi:hypothetical protein